MSIEPTIISAYIFKILKHYHIINIEMLHQNLQNGIELKNLKLCPNIYRDDDVFFSVFFEPSQI